MSTEVRAIHDNPQVRTVVSRKGTESRISRSIDAPPLQSKIAHTRNGSVAQRVAECVHCYRLGFTSVAQYKKGAETKVSAPFK